MEQSCRVIPVWLWTILVLSLLAFSLSDARAEGVAKDRPAENLLLLNLSDGKEGDFPSGFKITSGQGAEGKVHLDYKVFVGIAGPSIRFDLSEKGNLWLDASAPLQLETARKYLFSVRVKVRDMFPGGPCTDNLGVTRGVLIYVHSVIKPTYTFAGIIGNGNTEGWVTAMLPFDTGANPDLVQAKIFLRCYDLSGTVWFQDPVLIEQPDGFQMKAQFVQENGDVVSGNLLKLKN